MYAPLPTLATLATLANNNPKPLGSIPIHTIRQDQEIMPGVLFLDPSSHSSSLAIANCVLRIAYSQMKLQILDIYTYCIVHPMLLDAGSTDVRNKRLCVRSFCRYSGQLATSDPTPRSTTVGYGNTCENATMASIHSLHIIPYACRSLGLWQTPCFHRLRKWERGPEPCTPGFQTQCALHRVCIAG